MEALGVSDWRSGGGVVVLIEAWWSNVDVDDDEMCAGVYRRICCHHG